MTATAMKNLFNRLQSAGYTKPLVKRALPDWWSSEAEKDPSAVYEAKMRISRYFGLDLHSLIDEGAEVAFRNAGSCQFKTTIGTEPEHCVQTQALAQSLAEAAIAGTRDPFRPLPDSPAELRNEILGSGAPWVGFSDLLTYLWSHGIPVLFLPKVPRGWRKMHGMVMNSRGRPAIILARNEQKPAWQLFILAHEVGHILSGHIEEGKSIVDEKVDEQSRDMEEQEANEAAIALLTGKSGTNIRSNSGKLNAGMLSAAARAYGEQNQINPGHIILNYGHTVGHMPTARAALNIAERDESAPAILTAYMLDNIDPSTIPDDAYHRLLDNCTLSN